MSTRRRQFIAFLGGMAVIVTRRVQAQTSSLYRAERGTRAR